MTLHTLHTLQWRAAERSRTEQLWREIRNEQRRDRRRWLYHNDPIWRLSKLKANWESRERARRGL